MAVGVVGETGVEGEGATGLVDGDAVGVSVGVSVGDSLTSSEGDGLSSTTSKMFVGAPRVGVLNDLYSRPA